MTTSLALFKNVPDADLAQMGRRGNRGSTSYSDNATSKAQPLCGRSEILHRMRERLDGLLAARNQAFVQVSNYSDLFNSWLVGLYPKNHAYRAEQEYGDDGERIWRVLRRVTFLSSDGVVELNAESCAYTQKEANDQSARYILRNVKTPKAQMDEVPSKESIQGDTTQESVKDSNTIITRDQQETESKSAPEGEHLIVSAASSEPLHQFPSIVGRWMPLKKITVNTTQKLDALLATYYLPETFLSDQAKCAPNTLPFETFVYGRYEVHMKFVVNANKFHCGKVVVSAKFDSYQADDVQKGFQGALGRKHIILDLSANNEGTLQIPFRYHRCFVRNLAHANSSVAVRPGKYASVYVQILSPLRTGSGGANDMDIRPFYCLKKADFAGMSYKVALTQMDAVGTLMQALPTPALKELIGGVEKALDQLGKSHNQDKPTDNRVSIYVPKPRLHFPNGKGLSDATVMRMNPTALTSFNSVNRYKDEPRTTLDIARIWGLRSSFEWKNSATEGTELFSSIIDPTCRLYSSDYTGQPTPLEYVASFYQFWSGPIELRFDFVSNSFHTGAVIISAEYNRESHSTDECESHSTYTKVFHLGDQKSVDFRIPYIYDTVMRRSTGLAYCPLIQKPKTSTDIKKSAMNVRPESKMKVKVRVVNALRPVSTAPQTIDVLVFMRAGKKFVLHGLKQSDFTDVEDVQPLDSFPNDNYLPIEKSTTEAENRTKREAGKEDPDEAIINGDNIPQQDRFVPRALANQWNEYSTSGLAKAQMDNGEKEDEDPTENFAHGISSFGLQSLDSQVGIKDILRRPTLLFNNVIIDSTNTGYFVPLMPPSRMFGYIEEKETLFNSLITMTPQAKIMDLFRFWRGSMRYTIVFTGSGGAPIYITHVPHTGTRLYAAHRINNVPSNAKIPIYGCGLTTELVIPSVNPSVVIEAPYDTENNWTLTFDESAVANFSWRDKGDTNAGHLVITPTTSARMSIWWSAGDDFEVANFYGIPNQFNNRWAYQYSDETIRTQMDDQPAGFRLSNVSTAVGTLLNVGSEVLTPKRVATAALCSLPVVGPAFATAVGLEAIGSVKNTVASTVDNIERGITDRMDSLANHFGQSLDTITSMITTTLNGILAGMTSATQIISYCYDIILDIMVAWIDKSWTAVGFGVVRFLGKILGLSSIAHLVDLAAELGRSIAETLRPEIARTQAPRDTAATITGVLAGIVGTLVGVRVSPYRSYPLDLVARITSAGGVSYLFSMLKYVEAIFSTVKEMLMGVLGYVSPETAAMRMLSSSSPQLASFITDAQIMTSEANAAMTHNPNFRHRFWSTVMQAYQIQKLLIQAPPSSASPVLSRLCSEVIKVGNEKFIDISASPVRYEPYVICLEGESGIGKSDMVEALVSELLSGIELSRPHSGATYYRMPGSRFWSGYRDQPVVVYDDWLNLTDPQLACQQISELYQLKSTATFIPEMAHLEEKKIRGNPLIIILLCNRAFPESVLTNLAHTQPAIYRRRDILLKVGKKPFYESVHPREMTIEEQETMAHLEFQRYEDPSNKDSPLGGTKVSFEETAKYLKAKFARWHKQEMIKVKRRLHHTQAGMIGASIDQVRLDDPFLLYYNVSNSVAEAQGAQDGTVFLPSELLAAEVNRIARLIEQHQTETPVLEVPPEPRSPFVPQTQLDILSKLAISLAGAKYTWQAIVGMGIKAMERVGSWILSDVSVSEQCSICADTKPPYLKCVNSQAISETRIHYVCRECTHSAREAGRPLTSCPECRNPSLQIFTDEVSAMHVGLIARLALRLTWGTATILRALQNVFGKTYFNIILGVSRFFSSDLARALNLNEEYVSIFSRGGAAVDTACQLGNMIRALATPSTYLPPRVQADVEEIEDPFGMGGRPLIEPNPRIGTMGLDCELQYLKAENMYLHSRDHGTPCFHRYLRDPENVLTYLDGSFKTRVETHDILIPESPCENDCNIADASDYIAIMAGILRIHRPQYINHVVGYINSPTGREYHRARIPEAMRPPWMRDTRVVEREVIQLTIPTWWENLTGTWEKYKLLILAVGGVSTAIAGILTLRSIFAQNSSGEESLPRLEYVPSGDERTRHLARTTRQLQRVRPTRPHFQQVQETPDLDTVVKKYVANNYVTLEITLEGGERRLLTACGLFGHKALLPRHYVKAIRRWAEEGRKMRAGPALLEHNWKEYTFDEADFITSTTTDLAVWTLPPSFALFKDIRKFLCTDDDLTKPISTVGSILLAPNRRNVALKEVILDIAGLQSSEIVEDADGERFEAFDVICYNYSQPGACGSLIFTNRTTRPIMAMHFAGMGNEIRGEGFGIILTKESLGEIIANQVTSQMEDYQGPSLEEAKIIFPENVNVTYLGSIPRELETYMPKKTKIRPSLIQNVNGLQPLTEPCILDKTDPRYMHEITPLVAGCMKHGVSTLDFTTTQVKKAENALWDGWISKMKPLITSPRKFTPEEACVGIAGMEYYDPMVLNTSAGFPFSSTGKKKKEDYITFQRNANLQPISATIDDQVLNVIREKEEKRRNGLVPFTPFIDTLKDERKKPLSVRKLGGTRVFCNPPVDYVIAMRQSFLHFTAAFMADRFNQQHAVGINLTGTEWTMLARKLIAKSPNNIVTLDYSNFGPGFNAGVAQAAANIMIKWTMENVEGVDEAELTNLMNECIYSTHICSNTVYHQKCGSPSGAPITVIMNSLVNILLILIAWEQLVAAFVREIKAYLWEEFKKNVCLFVYGDDLIMSVTDKYIKMFNAQTISDYFKQYNIVATDAGKSDKIEAYNTITKATFLKHAFVKHERYSHLWQSALDWTSINDTTQWIWECPDPKEATYENCKAALEQAHGHGKIKYDTFKERINGALIKANCVPINISWEEIDNIFYPDLIY